ncbi:MAG TPA: hypothetical protein DCQ06_14175 [Myxococcales bacterium]|nr:hypothetical protein [Myxococcales bacterium]HAN32736.1 hypothetical protein [Myxococcales bacterium]
MSDVTQGPLIVVTGEDPVAAGMLALDLVQNGLNAHAVADIWSAMEQLAAQEQARPVLVTGYSSLQRTLDAWRSIRLEGLHVAHVAVVDLTDYAAGEAAASAADWLGVVPRPVHVASLVSIITGQETAHGVEETGSLAATGLATLLERALFAARRDVSYADNTVYLRRKDRNGMVVIRRGELVHAEADEDHGRHALERMFCWTEGSFRMTWSAEPGPQTLNGSWRTLMSGAHEYARRVQEARRTMSFLDESVQVRWERVRPLPVVAESLFRRLARGMTVGAAIDGEGDDELEVYAALQSRIRRGAVVSFALSQQTNDPQFSTTIDAPFASIAANPVSTMPPSSPPAVVGSSVVSSGLPLGADQGNGPGSTVSSTAAQSAPGMAPIRQRMGSGAMAPVTATPSPQVPASPGGRPPVLPTALPEVDSDHYAPVSAPPQLNRSAGARTTGWFGLQVGTEAAAPVSIGPAEDVVVPPVPAPPPSSVPTTTHVVADIPRPEGPQITVDSIDTHYQLFTEGMESEPPSYEHDVDVDFDDLLRPRRRWPVSPMWIAAAMVLVGAVILVIWPNSPLYNGPSDGRELADASYLKAVELIDSGKVRQGQEILEKIVDRAAPEAMLQLAVIKAGGRQFDESKSLLKRYITHQDAKHQQRAKRLLDHLFGDP